MDITNPSPLAKLLTFLKRLEDHKVWYRLEHIRDWVMVLLAIPGERWEVEFFEDGHVEVERFISNGEIADEDLLQGLFRSEEDARLDDEGACR